MKQCAACNHSIDPSARICPFCGANPDTGEKIVDADALLREMFTPKPVTPSENVLEYARQRQGVVIAVSVFIGFLILAGMHQFVKMRNAKVVSDAPAISLSEITDVTRKGDEARPVDIPDLDFFYDGRPHAMRTYIVEPGAIAPLQPPAAGALPPTAAASPAPRPATR